MHASLFLQPKKSYINRQITSTHKRKETNAHTLQFFHQNFRFSFPALASNCDAPACKASAPRHVQIARQKRKQKAKHTPVRSTPPEKNVQYFYEDIHIWSNFHKLQLTRYKYTELLLTVMSATFDIKHTVQPSCQKQLKSGTKIHAIISCCLMLSKKGHQFFQVMYLKKLQSQYRPAPQ